MGKYSGAQLAVFEGVLPNLPLPYSLSISGRRAVNGYFIFDYLEIRRDRGFRRYGLGFLVADDSGNDDCFYF